MSNKTSVIFLKDWSILVKSLSKENQIVFWEMFMNYDCEQDNICKVETVAPVWNFIKMQLEKMDSKYQKNVVQRNIENGKKGGRPKKIVDNQQDTKTQDNPKNPIGFSETQKTLNDNVNVNDNVNDNKIKNTLLSEIKISDVPLEILEFYKIAKSFQDLFIKNLKQKNAPTKKIENAKFKTFVDPIRLMMTVDGVTIEQLKTVYKYLESPSSDFWKSNILSTSKLRIQIEKLILSSQKTNTVIVEKPQSATEALKNRLHQLGIPTIKNY